MTIQDLLLFLVFLLTNFTQFQCNSTESITFTTWTSEVTTAITSNQPSEATSVSLPSTYVTSPTTQFSSTYVTTSAIQSSLISTESPSTGVTTVTTQPRNVTLYLIYQFTVSSSEPLELGNFTNTTILNSVETMVNSTFNTTNFSVTVIRVEIRSSAKASLTYQMLTENQFQTSSSCLSTCIQNAASNSTPTQTFQLLANNGSSFATVTAQSAGTYVSEEPTGGTTTMASSYQTGEPPPGVAGQLGMGLGISFMAVLVVVEVVFLYRKYGLNPSNNRQSRYEMSYHQRLSE